MLFRWLIIAATVFLSGYTVLRPPEGGSWSNYQENFKSNIKLGLDLQGGIYMQVAVDEDDALAHYLEEQAGMIKTALEGEKITVASSAADKETNRVTLFAPKASDGQVPLKLIEDRFSGYWSVDQKGADVVLTLREQAIHEVKDEAVNQTVYKIQSRVDTLGVSEPVINRTVGTNRIVLELAGASDSQTVHKLVREPGQLEWRIVVPNTGEYPSEEALAAAIGRPLSPNEKVLPMADRPGFMVLQEVMLTAKNVTNVRPSVDERGLPAVGVQLDRTGGAIMNEKSGANIGNRLAIVLDGKVVSAPTIQSQLSDSFIIMGLSQSEVEPLIVKIKSGSLPAKVNILEESVIGPTLGRDAIRSGSTAAVLGVIIVAIFMLLYYRGAGVVANIALLINIVLIAGCMAGIGAVLTLPGIAGFVLIIGMAVDANVLVFERVREELRAGIMPKNALEIGFKTSFVTILDANITTMLSGFILWMLGEGPVKGFATMLMIGISCSIFSAVFCSRTIYLWLLQRNPKAKTLSIWPVWQSGQVTAK